MSVIWKNVVGYEGLYEVSSDGQVRGAAKEVEGNHLKPTRKLPARMKKQSSSMGYKVVTLFRNGVPKIYKVHRLVAQSFIENPDNCPIINHIDNDKTNNDITNLEWTTYQGNMDHKVRQNRQSRNLGRRAGKSCKLTEDDVQEIRDSSLLQKELAKKFNISQQQVSKIRLVLRWAGVAGSKDCEVCQ